MGFCHAVICRLLEEFSKDKLTKKANVVLLCGRKVVVKTREVLSNFFSSFCLVSLLIADPQTRERQGQEANQETLLRFARETSALYLPKIHTHTIAIIRF